eukprot:5683822-Lingulodinium_polyedra.AAC.1
MEDLPLISPGLTGGRRKKRMAEGEAPEAMEETEDLRKAAKVTKEASAATASSSDSHKKASVQEEETELK